MIYFDHAASSWPKPTKVIEAVTEAIQVYGANPGRGSHRLANLASKQIMGTRKKIAQLFGIKEAKQIIFYNNATFALNQAIKGFDYQAGDKVIATMYEHNSVRRPLEYLHHEYGVEIIYITPDHNGAVNLDQLEKEINTKTKLLICTHVSNVTGAILPIKEIGELAKKHQIPYLVDASQSAGSIPINVQELHIDLMAFAGHKGLLGPQGTGGLYIAPHLSLKPFIHGGTGNQSELTTQPEESPARYEAGTLNTPGIAGLKAGVSFILEQGIERIYQHEQELTRYALEQLSLIDSVTIYGPDLDKERAAVISFNLAGVDPQELATILDEHYQIATRAGLHCTPLAHQALQTEKLGTVRISFGYSNTKAEIDQFVRALHEISQAFLAT